MTSLRNFLSDDHARLDALLDAACRGGQIDGAAYADFRRGLLRHIGIEERILFPEMRRAAAAGDLEQRLHRDHAALAGLLVPPPDEAIIGQIRAILAEHNPLEEDAGGMYEIVERLSEVDMASLMSRVRSYPEVPVAPYSDSPAIRRTIEQLLQQRRPQ